MNCREVIELVSQGLDRELTASEQAAIKRHMQECGPCFRYDEQIRALHEFFAKYGADVLEDACLTEDVRARIRKAVSASSGS